ncbi:hypothetical protein ABBQ38_001860 [Trebouxia sp. C0009 RCD-2024]
MQERVYEGLNPNCNKGHPQVLPGKPEALREGKDDLMVSDEELFQGSGSPHSGDSTRTHTASLPIRRQQRRPCKKTVQAEAHSPPADKQKEKQGRQSSNKTGSKPRGVAKASKAAKLHNKLPACMRELASPIEALILTEQAVLKPLLKGEIEDDLAKIISQAQTGGEEDQIDCGSKGKGRGGANKGRQAKRGQEKLKGPCANCPLTATVAWRKGAPGRAYAGQPLCNGCGMYASRHPHMDEAALKKRVRELRRAQGVSKHAEATTSAQVDSNNMCRATAMNTAATAAAPDVPTASKVQRRQGRNDLVARVPLAAQSSGMQLTAEERYAATAGRSGDSVCSEGAGMQGGQGRGAKSRKRSAEASSAQPAAKRSAWKIEAFPGPLNGSDGQHNSSETASVAGLEGGGCSSDGQEGAKGERASRSSYRAAKRRHYERREEAGNA